MVQRRGGARLALEALERRSRRGRARRAGTSARRGGRGASPRPRTRRPCRRSRGGGRRSNGRHFSRSGDPGMLDMSGGEYLRLFGRKGSPDTDPSAFRGRGAVEEGRWTGREASFFVARLGVAELSLRCACAWRRHPGAYAARSRLRPVGSTARSRLRGGDSNGSLSVARFRALLERRRGRSPPTGWRGYLTVAPVLHHDAEARARGWDFVILMIQRPTDRRLASGVASQAAASCRSTNWRMPPCW